MTATATAHERTEWDAWRRTRWQAVYTPHGIAALADTAWLVETAQPVAGVPGLWRANGAVVVGEGLADASLVRSDGTAVGDSIELRTGENVVDGARLLRAFERDGQVALRVIDPDVPHRVNLSGIDTYPYDPALRLPALFEPSDEGIDIELVDGHHTRAERTGRLHVELASGPVALTVTVRPDALSAVIGDATSGVETYRFRFVTAPLPDKDGRTVLDFNRAHLPPCAFSPHYVCPLPPPGNRVPIPLRAGEKLPLQLTADQT